MSPALDLLAHMVEVQYWHRNLVSIWTEIHLVNDVKLSNHLPHLFNEIKLSKSTICLYTDFAKTQKPVNKIKQHIQKRSNHKNNVTFSFHSKSLSKTYIVSCKM